MTRRFLMLTPVLMAGLFACNEAPAREGTHVAPEVDTRLLVVVRDTIIADVTDAPARTEPLRATTLSTKLMAHVLAVRVREGDRVSSGALLIELDARDIQARREQAEAALQSAEAAQHEADLHAARIRALFADSAAPRAHLDAAEATLARASQAVRAARAGVNEVQTLTEQATLHAPFAGVIVQRFVDEGAFVAPGSPMVRIEDPSRLRVIATVPPALTAGLTRNATIDVTIEGVAVRGRIEGIVPAPGAALVQVQALVENGGLRFSSGSAASIAIPAGTRQALFIPATALVTAGDLTGVRIRSGDGVATRWIRVGRRYGTMIEVLSGVSAGDTLVMPIDPAGA